MSIYIYMCGIQVGRAYIKKRLPCVLLRDYIMSFHGVVFLCDYLRGRESFTLYCPRFMLVPFVSSTSKRGTLCVQPTLLFICFSTDVRPHLIQDLQVKLDCC